MGPPPSWVGLALRIIPPVFLGGCLGGLCGLLELGEVVVKGFIFIRQPWQPLGSLPQPGWCDRSPRHQLHLGTDSTSQKGLWEEFLGQVTLTWQRLLPGGHRDHGALKKRCSCLGPAPPSPLCSVTHPGSASLGGTSSQLPLIHQLARAGQQREAHPSRFSRVGLPGSLVWLPGICLPNIPHQPGDLKGREAAVPLSLTDHEPWDFPELICAKCNC